MMTTATDRTREIRQTQLNVNAVLRSLGLSEVAVEHVVVSQPDRVLATMPGGFLTSVAESRLFDRTRFFKNHGATAVASWRERRRTYSLQIVQHSTGVFEFDIDFRNPRVPTGTVGHFFEVIANAVTGNKTNPFKIREGLLKRGLTVGEAQ